MEMQQLVIAGAGPAGVSAALYAVRMGFPPLVIHNGYGALEKAEKIENYYGLPAPISGKELYRNGLSQLQALNVPVLKDELLSITYDGEYTIQTSENVYHTKALILATGTKRNTLSLKELKNTKETVSAIALYAMVFSIVKRMLQYWAMALMHSMKQKF